MCICSYACVHKCEYVNVETLNTALVKCMIRKHKPMPPLPALSLHPFPGGIEERRFSSMWLFRPFFSYSEQWQLGVLPAKHAFSCPFYSSGEFSLYSMWSSRAINYDVLLSNINVISRGCPGSLGHSVWSESLISVSEIGLWMGTSLKRGPFVWTLRLIAGLWIKVVFCG